ncbi:protein ARV1-like [Mytilus californianus]|uniref:protein ARV1-like n=1 Tax=Mytilus californianus TaxID=6549 RepID=UPI0022456C1D|nr:protein ARV1-like [Mytilus californianus]
MKCINCGTKCNSLYRHYSRDIIQLEHCIHCKELVDKYIEFDPVIICLDALLLKREAFQHVLSNNSTQAQWKLTSILLLFDAYTKLVHQRQNGDHTNRPMPDSVLYSAFEWDLYFNYFSALIELLVCVVVILLAFVIASKIMPSSDKLRLYEIVRGILLSNFGKILVIPAVLWGYNEMYVWLTAIFVCASNVQAFRVLCPSWPAIFCAVVVISSHVIASLTGSIIYNLHSAIK